MITVKVVEQCPYTVAGTGVIHIPHDILATLAGAVYDKDEWIALLVGTRSENGMDITVNSLRVPLQERNHSTCELAKPEPLTPEIVGVIHSHHSMGAFFSQTDRSTLNPRFPLSLVVSQVKPNTTENHRLLGFTYLAEGVAILPCGSPGIINFTATPDPLPEKWQAIDPSYVSPNMSIGLHDCPHVTNAYSNLVTEYKTTCGIETSEPVSAIFGRNGKQFMEEVEGKTQRLKRYGNGNGNNKHNNGYSIVDNRRSNYFRDSEEYDEQYLRHWGL